MITSKMINEEERVMMQAFLRTAIATYILGQMIDTPTHGLQGEASKKAKVQAAYDYADLLIKG